MWFSTLSSSALYNANIAEQVQFQKEKQWTYTEMKKGKEQLAKKKNDSEITEKMLIKKA